MEREGKRGGGVREGKQEGGAREGQRGELWFAFCSRQAAKPSTDSLERFGGFAEGSLLAWSRIMGPWLEMLAVLLGSRASELLLPVGGRREGLVCQRLAHGIVGVQGGRV